MLSLQKKYKKMLINGEEVETILDHNVTDVEIKRFGGWTSFNFGLSKGMYEEADNRYFHLGLLFSGRKDYERAAQYFAKIKHKSMLDVLIEDF